MHQSERDIKRATAMKRAYDLGYDVGLNRKYCKPVTNPYTKQYLAKEWRRGFLAADVARHNKEKAEGKALDPPNCGL